MDRNSIFELTKKKVGFDESYTIFDEDILTDINSVIAILTQHGIGPSEGFTVDGSEETWSDFLGEDDPRYNMVKTYIPLKVKLMFDNSTMQSSVIEATKELIAELEWRLYIQAEYDRSTQS